MSSIKDKNEVFGNMITALGVLLDCVDYTSGNCRLNEPVGGVLPKEIIERSTRALQDARRLTRDAPATGQTCPSCGGGGAVKRDGGNVGRCTVCDGTGQV